MSAEERTGERDTRLNDRHRAWGVNCPAVDIDLLLVEYHASTPVAIVEYKNEHAASSPASLRAILEDNKSVQTLRELGNMAGLPAFVTFYSDDYGTYRMHPLNARAERVTGGGLFVADEERYVEKLYEMRGRMLPRVIRDWIDAHEGGLFDEGF